MGNIKQALLEERNHLRAVRRKCRGEYDEAAFVLLSDSVKHMIRQFKKLEEPFIKEADREKGYHGVQKADAQEDYYNTNYKSPNLWQRISWVRTRSQVLALGDRLSRVQTRRIARTTTDIGIDTRYLTRTIQDLEDRVASMENRLSRIAGTRRSDMRD